MRGARAVLPILLLAGVAAATPVIVEFRTRRESSVYRRGKVLSHDERGFLFERFGRPEKRFFTWDELRETDRGSVRRSLGLPERVPGLEGKVAGERIHFKGGLTVDGLLERVDREDVHWVRSEGLLLPYPADRIERIETVRLPEEAVFDRRALLERRLARRGEPGDAAGHRDLADWLFAIGSFEAARDHYRAAIAARLELRYRLLGRLREIEDSLRDERVAARLREARAMSALRGDHDAARAGVEALIAAEPTARRPGLALLQEIEARAREDLAARFRIVKHRELRALLRHYLTTRRPTLEQAMAWATGTMPGQLRARVADALGIEPARVDGLAAARGRGAPHWASYWSGSFVVARRLAPSVRSSRSRVRADPDRWWQAYPEVSVRAGFLRAYAAERLPGLFEVVQVRLEDCERCGGRGRLVHASLEHPVPGQGHEWTEPCPRCFGCGCDRVVAFR